MPEPSEKDRKMAQDILRIVNLENGSLFPYVTELRVEKEAAVKEAESRGMQKGLKKALEIIDEVDRYYRFNFPITEIEKRIKKAAGKAREK